MNPCRIDSGPIAILRTRSVLIQVKLKQSSNNHMNLKNYACLRLHCLSFSQSQTLYQMPLPKVREATYITGASWRSFYVRQIIRRDQAFAEYLDHLLLLHCTILCALDESYVVRGTAGSNRSDHRSTGSSLGKGERGLMPSLMCCWSLVP